jgi:hypothetical protein
VLAAQPATVTSWSMWFRVSWVRVLMGCWLIYSSYCKEIAELLLNCSKLSSFFKVDSRLFVWCYNTCIGYKLI